MRHSLRIGRIFGIDLRVDASWLFIVVLMMWSLPQVFFAWHPEWSLLTVLFVAAVATLMFFGSVLMHELAHSLVARAYGVPTRDITLHMFGGVSNIEQEPPSPMTEALIAVVGPFVSVGLGLAMTLLGALSLQTTGLDVVGPNTLELAVSRLGPFATLLLWLGPINVMIGIFNMIPGFPLDGGRLLRALLWRISGDRRRATRTASRVGQLVGWTFIAMGIFMALGRRVPFLGTGLVSGMWLALIGLFLRNIAIAHHAGAAMGDALAGLRVRDLMRTQGPWVPASTPVRALIDDFFLVRDERALPVFEQARFVGLVCFQDVRRVAPAEWSRRSAADVMTPLAELKVATPDEDVEVALRDLASSNVRQLPVIDDGHVVGMLFEGDVIRWLELGHEARPEGTRAWTRPTGSASSTSSATTTPART